MPSTSVRSLRPLVPGAVIGVVVGALVFPKGAVDYRYLLADLKEDPLYLRGPGPSIVVGVVATVIVLFIGIVVPAILRDRRRAVGASGTVSTGTSPVLAALGWVLVVGGGWGGYALGGVASIAAGAPTEHPGTIRLDFGAPVHATAEAPARCRTPPGQPGVVAILMSEVAGLRVQLLDPVTGAQPPYPAPTGVWVSPWVPSDRSGTKLVVPGMPQRPPMYSIATGNATVFERPPVGILDVYLYNVISADVGEGSGHLVASAERSRAYLGVVNDLIPDDPWPEAFTLTLSWTCDLAATLPSQQPVPASPAVVSLPSMTPGQPSSAAGTTPALVRLVTNGPWASVRIAGATIASSEQPRIDGAATAALEGSTLRIEQSPGGVAGGRAVGATLAVSLTDVAPGEQITIAIDGDRSGPQSQVVAVTISNVLGQEPVPVFAFERPLQWLDGSPVPVDASLLIGPIRRAAG